MSSNNKLRVTTLPAGNLSAAAPTWQALDERFGQGGLSTSWEWTRTWLEHYGDIVPHFFVVAQVDDTPCGVALVTEGVGRRRGPFPLRTVHFGTAGEPAHQGVYVEYNRLLASPAHHAAFSQALVALVRQRHHWDELVLDGFAVEDAEAILAAEPTFIARREASRVVRLDTARAHGGDVLSSLPKSTGQKIRRSMRGFGAIQCETAGTPEQATDILDDLISLHQHRWSDAGERGAFASARFESFHRALVPQLLRKGRVILFRTRVGERVIGCLYVLVDRGRALSYQSGLAQFNDNKLRPGMTTELLCMNECLTRGFTEYDLLAGDSRYKREMSNGQRELIWATARSRSLKAQAVHAATILARRRRSPDRAG